MRLASGGRYVLSPGRAATGLFSVVTAIAVLWLLTFVALDRRATEQQARRQVEAAAALIEEHARGRFDAVAQLLARVETLVGERDPRVLHRSEEDFLALREMAESLPIVVSLIVADESGHTQLGARVFPTGPTDISDRDYFNAQRERPGFFVGETILGRAAGEPVLTVSLPLTTAAGEFRGVVAATLRAEAFQNAYRTIGAKGVSRMMLTRADGTVVVSYPPGSAAGGSGRNADADAAGALVASSTSERYPVIASASVDAGTAYAGWRTRAAVAAVLTLIGLGGSALFFHALRRGLAREDRLQRERADAYTKLSHANATLQKLLNHRAVLIRETHHRAKNNIQIIGALLRLQLGKSQDATVREALSLTQSRLTAMADLHQVLYENDEAEELDMSIFLAKLGKMLVEAYGLSQRNVLLSIHSAPLRLDVDRALLVGLIVNEAVVNAIKHAFPPGRAGHILVSLRADRGGVSVSVEDDGVGVGTTAANATAGIGTQLLDALVRQINGSQALAPRDPAGAVYTVTFPIGSTRPDADEAVTGLPHAA